MQSFISQGSSFSLDTGFEFGVPQAAATTSATSSATTTTVQPTSELPATGSTGVMAGLGTVVVLLGIALVHFTSRTARQS